MIETGWSFCIVSAKGNDEILNACIEAILVECRDQKDFEIIVIGDVTGSTKSRQPDVKFYAAKERYFNLGNPLPKLRRLRANPTLRNLVDLLYKNGPISHKKNMAARYSKFDKLCILHDYIALEPGWMDGFKIHGSNWEVCMTVVKNMDGERYRDWCALDYKDIGPGLLPYDITIKEMYFSGAYFCAKRQFFIKNPLNEKLFWGEGEDIEWSLRVRELTVFSMNKNSSVRLLKLKSQNHAPYDAPWRESERRLLNEFSR